MAKLQLSPSSSERTGCLSSEFHQKMCDWRSLLEK